MEDVARLISKGAYTISILTRQWEHTCKTTPSLVLLLCGKMLHDLVNPNSPKSGFCAVTLCHADVFSAHRQISHKQGSGYDAGRGLALACWR